MVLHSGNFMEKQEEQPQYFDLCRTASEKVGVAIINEGAWKRQLGVHLALVILHFLWVIHIRGWEGGGRG